MKRRAVCRGLAVTWMTAIAGCAFGANSSSNRTENPPASVQPTPTSASERTDPPSTSPRTTTNRNPERLVENLSLDAWMLNQASADSPPRFEVELTNENDGPVAIGLGHTLYFGDPFDDSGLVLVPEIRDIGFHDTPEERTDGCWRSGGYSRVNDHLLIVELAPDGSVNERHSVYTHTDVDECYPHGEYPRRGDVFIDDQEQEVSLDVTLRVDEELTVSVDAAEPRLQER